jgi:hypothetical protein
MLGSARMSPLATFQSRNFRRCIGAAQADDMAETAQSGSFTA